MKPIKSLFITIILPAFLLPSCGNRKTKTHVDLPVPIYDYTLFPQGVILSGEMKENKTLYLIREDATTMAGFCIIDNNLAVVDKIPFFADSTGLTTFVYENECYSGQMVVDSLSMEIELFLPEISTWTSEPQFIHLKLFNTISKKIYSPEHFKNPVFNNIIAKKDILYGTARGYYTSDKTIENTSDYKKMAEKAAIIKLKLIVQSQKNIPLYLDIYQPEKNNLKKRPLLLFAHGGAFIFGDKENNMQRAIADYFVKRGYVVASINYRMGSILTEAVERTFYRNVQDTRAALRYLVHNKNQFGIDEEQIYLAGSSTGGIISLTTAFMDNNEIPPSIGQGFMYRWRDLGGLDDSGNKFTNHFRIAGVVSMWGGVSNLEMLNNHIPTLLFHGTDDDIVLNGIGAPFKEFMGVFHGFASKLFKMYGSAPIYDHLKAQNIPAKYVPFQGGKHDVHLNPDGSLNARMDTICNEIGLFLFENVAKQYFNYHLAGSSMVKRDDPTPVYQIDNIQNASVQWQIDGGLITKQTRDTIHVIWYSSYTSGTITAFITNENEASCKKERKIAINNT